LWEVRHGAATALREVLKVHGSGAGKALNMTEKEVISKLIMMEP
jgi:TATA-binding protein-associated factor